MNRISAKVIAHSKSPQGEELISYELVFPRYILPEFNTHREFSRNSASSRAIPYEKMIRSIEENMFIPVAWQKSHSGMQGKEYITEQHTIDYLIKQHKFQFSMIKDSTYRMHTNGVTKQILNRYLEPFMYHKVIVTTSKPGLENFFNLRCPLYLNEYEEGIDSARSRKDFVIKLQKRYPTNWELELKEFFGIQGNTDLLEWLRINKADAEIHISLLAEAMWDAYNESNPKDLLAGEYHIPYGEDIQFIELTTGLSLEDKIKVSIGMCARVSYTPVGDDTIPTAKTYINIYDKMVNAEPFHASPFEHVAKCMSEEEYSRFIRGDISLYEWLSQEYREEIKGWCRNFKGFIQERHRIEELKWRG